MASIGFVTKNADGSFSGQLKSLSIRADIEIVPNKDKAHETQPDYRVRTKSGLDLGAGWIRTGETSGKPYVSLSLAAPELPRRLYANLGRAAGQDDNDVYAIIWNPEN